MVQAPYSLRPAKTRQPQSGPSSVALNDGFGVNHSYNMGMNGTLGLKGVIPIGGLKVFACCGWSFSAGSNFRQLFEIKILTAKGGGETPCNRFFAEIDAPRRQPYRALTVPRFLIQVEGEYPAFIRQLWRPRRQHIPGASASQERCEVGSHCNPSARPRSWPGRQPETGTNEC